MENEDLLPLMEPVDVNYEGEACEGLLLNIAVNQFISTSNQLYIAKLLEKFLLQFDEMFGEE